jgi:uncharacterized protein
MSNLSEVNPVRIGPTVDRIGVVDSLRGAALCGVIVFNIVAMVGGFLGKELLAKAGPLDMAGAAVVILLIQGKARACFALLFGTGFGILHQRTSTRGQDFKSFYLRRMAVLLTIGLFNLSFLFFGDILILYAILGMATLLFSRLAQRTLWRLGLFLILVPPIAAGAFEAVSGAPLPNAAGLTPAQVAAAMPATLPVYRGGDYGAYIAANWHYYVDMYRIDTLETVVYNLSVLGLFLLGLWTARSGMLKDGERWRPFLRKVVLWCLPIGLMLSVVQGTRRMGIHAEGALHGVVTAAYAGVSIAAFGYIALLYLLLTRRWSILLRALAPVGRMTLTGYLAANAIGSFVFYGWGMGTMAGWNVVGLVLFGFGIFCALCMFSAAWLRCFRFGPAEWVWRSLTYGRAQPMRKQAPATGSAATG